MSEDIEFNETIDTGLKSATRTRTRTPKMFRVILYNDHYTTKDFVVEILKTIFNKPELEANKIMLDVHNAGQGVCGVYTHDIGISKVNQVHHLAQRNGFPLRSSLEEA